MAKSARCVLLAAAVGFCISIVWGVLGFALFTAPNSWWTDAFWDAVYISCPPWLLPENTLSWLLTPVLNAVLYAALAFGALLAKHLLRRRRDAGAV
jgi:hypothetical protein